MKWPEIISIEQAWELQKDLSKKVRIIPLKREPRYVGGVDAAFSEDLVYAAACIYRYPELTLVEGRVPWKTQISLRSRFSLISGRPCQHRGDQETGNKARCPSRRRAGYCAPAGIGIASHLGVLLGIPTIGCAKTRLVGEFEDPGGRKGSWSELTYEGRIVGAVLRTKDSVKPLFLSPGHKIDLDNAIRITLNCTGKYRIPEPLRCADMLSRKMRAGRGPR
jgi:deoxyribonuclease V